eukprot:SM000379S14410  [mRNA]  locus=s379:42811:43835:+ [translate_table: standard]
MRGLGGASCLTRGGARRSSWYRLIACARSKAAPAWPCRRGPAVSSSAGSGAVRASSYSAEECRHHRQRVEDVVDADLVQVHVLQRHRARRHHHLLQHAGGEEEAEQLPPVSPELLRRRGVHDPARAAAMAGGRGPGPGARPASPALPPCRPGLGHRFAPSSWPGRAPRLPLPLGFGLFRIWRPFMSCAPRALSS